MKSLLPRRPSAVAAAAAMAAAALAAGCGGSGSDSSTDAASTQVTETATVTATTPQSDAAKTTTTAKSDAQRTESPSAPQAQPVTAKTQTLKAGDVTSSVTVTKVADPLTTGVDEAQNGNKLVGVFVTAQTKGAQVTDRTITTLTTTGGKHYGVRVIADGDCAGAFGTSGVISAKKTTDGCIGFEIPKNAKPATLSLLLTSGLRNTKRALASWSLSA